MKIGNLKPTKKTKLGEVKALFDHLLKDTLLRQVGKKSHNNFNSDKGLAIDPLPKITLSFGTKMPASCFKPLSERSYGEMEDCKQPTLIGI